MTNKYNTVFYTGVTREIRIRVLKHKSKKYPNSFTAQYNVNKLVYYEAFDSLVEAIRREKQIKAGSRGNKVDLINSFNPDWADLSGAVPD